MPVKIGSARIDENGRATGGKPGDQTGREVMTENWYKHKKGWRVFRPLSLAVAEKSAYAMQAACDNPNIGYDQADRLTLYKVASEVGFDPACVKTRCETDCSALVRVCEAYAGVNLPNFTTDGEPRALLDSHEFMELLGSKYTDSSDYLKRGDVLVTATKGHTVIVLTNGSKADADHGDGILRNGDSGAAVRQMQEALIKMGYDCGRWGADGDFGDATEMALKAFQATHGLAVDGDYGPKSKAAVEAALKKLDAMLSDPKTVMIRGGSCYVRSAPNVRGKILGAVIAGEELPYLGETSPDGWHLIEFKKAPGWVSGKYGRLEA